MENINNHLKVLMYIMNNFEIIIIYKMINNQPESPPYPNYSQYQYPYQNQMQIPITAYQGRFKYIQFKVNFADISK